MVAWLALSHRREESQLSSSQLSSRLWLTRRLGPELLVYNIQTERLSQRGHVKAAQIRVGCRSFVHVMVIFTDNFFVAQKKNNDKMGCSTNEKNTIYNTIVKGKNAWYHKQNVLRHEDLNFGNNKKPYTFFLGAAAVFVGMGSRIFVFDIIDGSLLLMINTKKNQNQVNRKI